MRLEKEMFDLILNIAITNKRVQAVYMNGSRTNPNVIKDKYQDFDIVFVVEEIPSFLADKAWILAFGELSIMQEPNSNDFGWGKNHDFLGSYTWLMLFKDGTRIDLTIKTLTYALEDYIKDTLCVKLLDKNNILPQIAEPNDSLYWIKSPTKQEYLGCCNEFWWCLNNVAKGIARDQLPYAMRMYNQVIHNELDKMIEWYIGTEHDFSVATGMWGKYFKKYLPIEMYEQYTKTYANSDYDALWEAIFIACSLFRRTAIIVSDYLGYSYNEQDDKNMTAYIEGIKTLYTMKIEEL